MKIKNLQPPTPVDVPYVEIQLTKQEAFELASILGKIGNLPEQWINYYNHLTNLDYDEYIRHIDKITKSGTLYFEH